MTSFEGIVDNNVRISVMICLVAWFEVSVTLVMKIKTWWLVTGILGELCCLHFQGILKRGSSMEEVVVLYRESAGWVMGAVSM